MHRLPAKQSIPFPILLIIAAATFLLGYTTIARAETQSITLLGIEVTQGLQSMSEAEPRDSSQDNLIPLIKNRETLIRVYFDQPGQYRAKLKVSNAGEEPGTLLCSKNNGMRVAGLTNRSDLKSSLYFEVPDSLLKGEQIIIQSITLVNPKNKSRTIFTCSNCSTYRSPPYPLAEGIPLKLRLIGLSYVNGEGNPHAPTELEFLKILSWLRRTYPIPEVLNFPRRGPDSPTSDIVPYDTTLGDLFEYLDKESLGCRRTNEQLRLLKQADLDAHQSNKPEFERIIRTRYVGILSDSGFPNSKFVRGCANGDPNINSDLTVTAPVGNTQRRYKWDDDQFYGDWQVAHELGHTFGQSHLAFPNACGTKAFLDNRDTRVSPEQESQRQYVGLDFGDRLTSTGSQSTTNLKRRAIRGDWHDFMSYCPRSSLGISASKWVNPYSYNGILTALAKESMLSTGVDPLARPALAEANTAIVPSATFTPKQSLRQDTLVPATITVKQGRFVTALATINLSNRIGALTYVRENSLVRDPPYSAQEPIQLRITFKRGHAAIYPMQVQRYPDAHSQNPTMGTASVNIPIGEDKPIKVELLIDDTVADTIIVPQSSPILEVTDPSHLQTEQPLQLEWKASLLEESPVPNENPLTYTVQISYDKGQSWHTIATNLREQNFQLSPERIKGENDVQVKIIASDRYNITEQTVTMPQVVSKPDKPSRY